MLGRPPARRARVIQTRWLQIMITATTAVLLGQFYHGIPIVSAATASSAAVVGLGGDLISADVTADGQVTTDGQPTVDAQVTADGQVAAGEQISAGGKVTADAQVTTDTQVTADVQVTASLHGQGGDSSRSGENLVEGGGRSRSRTPLLDKYTFRETVRTVIEEDQLPELPEFLESIGLGHRLEDFYRKSVFETKYLFTVNDMDLRLMGLSLEEMVAVKGRASELKVERDVTEERLHPLLERRNELTYGRLFLDRSASSFEFYLAGFGAPAPVDGGRLVWAEPRDACRLAAAPAVSNSLSGAIVLAERGNCSFVDKANNVASSGAAALVVINNGDDAEDLFRVAATLGGRSGGEVEPKGPQDMATVLVRGSTLPSLSKALEWGSVESRLVPLDCKPGKAACTAVLPEEQEADSQVDSGTISVSSHPPITATTTAPTTHATATTTITTITDRKIVEGLPNIPEAFDFLSATFGSTLPAGRVSIVPSLPEDACTPLAAPAVEAIARSSTLGVGGEGEGEGAAVLVRRGGCSFGVKAKNVQDAGGRVIVIQDNGLGVLQNVGAPDPLAKELYIPGVFITEKAGDTLTTATTTTTATTQHPPGASGLTIRFDPDNSVGRAWGKLGTIPWPDDLLEARVLGRQLRATHAGSSCRSQWVADKVQQAA